MRIDTEICRDADLLAAEVRRLEAVIAASEPTLTDAEREVLVRLAERLNDWNMDDAEDVVRGILGRFK